MTPAEQLLAAWRLGVGGMDDEPPPPENIAAALDQSSLAIARYVSIDQPLSADTHNGLLIPIALYILAGQSFDEQHPIYVRYKDAIAWLMQLAEGKLDPDTGTGTGTSSSAGEPQFEAPERLFTASTLKGF